ncbi:hypothetical protein [Formosa haliotis]|uniref:hypothetical protein n=1 Tax=Formosa haliotis TaxID=1555194 RepID=UPI00135657EC|nr:hypothetical protein [Formosa haliotis]
MTISMIILSIGLFTFKYMSSKVIRQKEDNQLKQLVYIETKINPNKAHKNIM